MLREPWGTAFPCHDGAKWAPRMSGAPIRRLGVLRVLRSRCESGCVRWCSTIRYSALNCGNAIVLAVVPAYQALWHRALPVVFRSRTQDGRYPAAPAPPICPKQGESSVTPAIRRQNRRPAANRSMAPEQVPVLGLVAAEAERSTWLAGNRERSSRPSGRSHRRRPTRTRRSRPR